MLTEYILYLRDGRDGPAAFEPVRCETTSELPQRAREALPRHPECEAIDVYFGDAELFQVRQARPLMAPTRAPSPRFGSTQTLPADRSNAGQTLSVRTPLREGA